MDREGVSGAPGEIRTPDPLLRRQTLYPTELRALRVSPSILTTYRPLNSPFLWLGPTVVKTSYKRGGQEKDIPVASILTFFRFAIQSNCLNGRTRPRAVFMRLKSPAFACRAKR